MKQVFHHHSKWEDAAAGLYARKSDMETVHVTIARAVLSAPNIFRTMANQMIREWVFSAEVNLSNASRNRQAWTGQATCCFVGGCPEFTTKVAWNLLTPEQQAAANAVADQVIAEWESNFKGRTPCQSATLK